MVRGAGGHARKRKGAGLTMLLVFLSLAVLNVLLVLLIFAWGLQAHGYFKKEKARD